MEIFFLHERGRVFTSFELSFLLGVNVAPTVSGFIVNNASWTWSFWWTLIPCVIAIVLVFVFLEETGGYAEKSRPFPEQPTLYLNNRVATFFPGNKIVPRTTLAETVRNPDRI